MPNAEPYRVKTVAELHARFGLPRPEHPLIGVIDFEQVQWPTDRPASLVLDFYTISLKRHCKGAFRYGQQQYDFGEGVMFFMAPGQIFGSFADSSHTPKTPITGSGLYIHPDFLWKTPLAKSIHRYEYFNYSVNEALWLTEKEETTIIGLMQNIHTECLANIDHFSQPITISLIETLLNYAERFYSRQFLTRKMENHLIVDRLEDLLNTWFLGDNILTKGLPSVPDIAKQLNLSPNYLSSLLKTLTGRNTQQHIQDKMIEKAKETISTTELSVSEISYALGFEHPQSFSRLFKAKTGLSPLEFRQRFN